MKTNKQLSIAVCGLWHLGLVTSVCLAKSGYKVFGFDLDKKNVEELNLSKLPIYEPGLSRYFKKCLHKSLYFDSNPKQILQNKDYVFITLDTPVDKFDEVNLSSINKLFNLVTKYSLPTTTIIISSQVPVGTTRSLIKKIGINSKVIYFPENLRLGSAINDFLKPTRIVLGSDSEDTIKQFLKDFPIFKCEVLNMSVESAEMLKHALNSFLALNISFSSELSDLCELFAANALDVVAGLKSDPRISPKAPLNPGLGFSGGTLGRDVKTLINLSKKINYPTKLLSAVYEVNQDRISYLLTKIKKVFGSFNGKKIGILGLTYKPNTDTLRGSQSLELAAILANKKAEIRGFDPAIKNQKINSIILKNSLEDFLKNLDLLILMTQWPQFRAISPKLASSLMTKRIIIDTKNFLDQQKFLNYGFIYFGIGQGK